MLKIRTGTFETNSSSTHSLVIHKMCEMNWPEDKSVPFKICREYPKVEAMGIGEVSKTLFILGLIASTMIEDDDIPYRGVSDTEFTEYLKKHNQWICWLLEIVKEKVDIDILLSPVCKYAPYFSDGFVFEDDDVYSLMGIPKDYIENESFIKSIFIKYIFDPNIVLQYTTEEW